MRSAIARWAMGWIRKIGEPTTRRKTRRPRHDTATEPRFKPERLDSFLRNESGFPKLRRTFGKENAMAKKSIIAVVSVAALILPLSAFAQGSAGTGSTSTGIGAPAGPAGPGIRSNGWTQHPEQRRTLRQPEAPISARHQKNSI